LFSCGAKKIIAFLGETFGIQTMRRIGMTPDGKAMTAVDYANISEDKRLQDLVSEVIGDKLLQVKPKSLIEVEEKLEAQLLEETKMISTTTNGGYTSKMQATLNNPATLKDTEVAIFSKKYETHQNIPTAKGHSVPQSFVEDQRKLKAQRELEA